MIRIKIKARSIRVWIPPLLAATVLVAAILKLGWGTLCSFGPDGLAYLCPLGFLQTAVAGRVTYAKVWLPLLLTLGTIVVFGRYFCSWACPTALLRSLFRREGPELQGSPAAERRRGPAAGLATKASSDLLSRSAAAPLASTSERPQSQKQQVLGLSGRAARGSVLLPVGAGQAAAPAWRRWVLAIEGRHLLLAATLAASALFHFPVFCLVCPVGLFFGFVFAITRLFSIQQPSLELILYPAILGLEIFVLRKWCRSLCPLGALLSLLSVLNPFFRPAIRTEACLVSSGVNCQSCRRACPEGLDLRQPAASRPLNNCTKCLTCSDRCPVHAISFRSRS